MAITEINKDNYSAEVLESEKPVLVDFYADWCGPCRMIRPTLEEIAEENDKVKIVSVNIEDGEELAEKYEVSSIPCLVLFKDGKEEQRSVGLVVKEEIEKMIGGE
ncbi:MAG: thioredoxin [Candidatus Saccharibacteria bacterium]|nr:thioredoxin [Candidatus Saccharibacteria bacterium]